MNKGLYLARKNYLHSIIYKISYHHGGDKKEWLEGHFTEVLDAYPDEKIEEAIICYTEMVEQLKYYPKLGV